MSIDESAEQPENADSSIRETLEFDSNVTFESLRQPVKQLGPITSVEEGMWIDERDEQSENARPSIRERWESDSNVTVERTAQFWKQAKPICSILLGI
jgi:hypothetical protein